MMSWTTARRDLAGMVVLAIPVSTPTSAPAQMASTGIPARVTSTNAAEIHASMACASIP